MASDRPPSFLSAVRVGKIRPDPLYGLLHGGPALPDEGLCAGRGTHAYRHGRNGRAVAFTKKHVYGYDRSAHRRDDAFFGRGGF
ncbi:hypothetical protein SDC9_202796 [bioreactor metagenome]|uniref:Uncharacterized protein n=1 Tax=bioreactor metagenome TaxID=1076179 RepID=A0A645IVE8_9ZZZZ